MKTVLLVVVAMILISGVSLWIAGKDTKVVTTQIDISATPEKVWSVLANIEGWKDWSPIIKESRGKAALNSKLVITMSGKNGKEGEAGQTYEPFITKIEDSRNLTWSATMGPSFVMTNGKVLELEETSTGTRLTHKETFSGMMVPLMWGMVQKNVPQMLNSMNIALKNLVETH